MAVKDVERVNDHSDEIMNSDEKTQGHSSWRRGADSPSQARLSLLALRLAVREMGLPLPSILYQNPRLVPRTVY